MRLPVVLSKPGTRLSLSETSTHPPKAFDREAAHARLAELDAELGALQELMWGAREHSLLLILQGRDGAGKDGTIKRVAGAFNPRGVNVLSFGKPTPEEAEHDFLWRIHRHAPRRGEVAIFNRSHYEDVLVPRVHRLVKKPVWKARYDRINDFEALLAQSGCIVLKVFLHISKEEQYDSLIEREKDPLKSWKIDPVDWQERARWNAYGKAYEEVFERCASAHAPWHIVPADSKLYRNFVVAEGVAAALRPYHKRWATALEEKGRAGKAALRAARAKSK